MENPSLTKRRRPALVTAGLLCAALLAMLAAAPAQASPATPQSGSPPVITHFECTLHEPAVWCVVQYVSATPVEVGWSYNSGGAYNFSFGDGAATFCYPWTGMQARVSNAYGAVYSPLWGPGVCDMPIIP